MIVSSGDDRSARPSAPPPAPSALYCQRSCFGAPAYPITISSVLSAPTGAPSRRQSGTARSRIRTSASPCSAPHNRPICMPFASCRSAFSSPHPPPCVTTVVASSAHASATTFSSAPTVCPNSPRCVIDRSALPSPGDQLTSTFTLPLRHAGVVVALSRPTPLPTVSSRYGRLVSRVAHPTKMLSAVVTFAATGVAISDGTRHDALAMASALCRPSSDVPVSSSPHMAAIVATIMPAGTTTNCPNTSPVWCCTTFFPHPLASRRPCRSRRPHPSVPIGTSSSSHPRTSCHDGPSRNLAARGPTLPCVPAARSMSASASATSTAKCVHVITCRGPTCAPHIAHLSSPFASPQFVVCMARL